MIILDVVDNKNSKNEFDNVTYEINMIELEPSKKLKLFFWIILGNFSFLFAEVISGATMLPYYDLWSLCVTFPLYTLHILVLSYIVFNHGKPNIYTLFLAGMIYGMYEAYITKVLWEPYWAPNTFKLGGIAVFEFFLLVFWWHAFFAFIIPLLCSENLLTKSRDIMNYAPEKVQNLFSSKRKSYLILILFALWCGGFQSINSFKPAHSLLSGFTLTIILGILVLIWRKKTGGVKFTMYQLLPNQKQFFILLVFTIILYLITGIIIRPEALPDIGSQIIIWILYAIIFILFYLNLRKSKEQLIKENYKPPIEFSWKLFIILAFTFTLTSTLIKFIPDFSFLFFLFGVILGIGIGVILFIISIIKAIRKNP